ncbi:MAG: twin-arginine translocation signal domain-containing protein [Chloroflexi bacterium]|nr:twin-arginine translocation signal domain-containing protein [Chloroflexota bacterium]
MDGPVAEAATQSSTGARRSLSRRDLIKLSGGTTAAIGALGALGVSLAPSVAQARTLRIQNARAVPTICPYCAVGCGMIAHTINGQIVNIEGNPDSPINEGNLCPKGAASYQLAVNEKRWTTVKYRAPNSDQWEDRPLDWAMDRIAQLVKQTRDDTFQERSPDGQKTLMSTTAIFSLGGATIDNEWNYSHSKLMRGLGIVPIENQARI